MNYDVEISEKKQEKQDLLDKMEFEKSRFLEELTKFTINWFEKETLSTIKASAEKVVELGEDKARELKGKIKELKEEAPDLVQRYMGEESLWWHTNEDRVSYYSGNRRLLDKHQDKIRLMLGELGSILKEYGLIEVGSEFNRNYTSSWSYEGYAGKSKIKYGYGFDFSRELYDINAGYLDLIKQAQDVNEQINKLEDKKKQENVEEWWQSL
ncbi:hypothetical protein HNV23_08910 [Bacillus paranthracis]|uniref:hypothetical protein n=1 Tax=Bacillus paranthracis TaxID=2026186 RepID=UPI00148F169A|nr:hypothetical protein [Bacillus paranthracis]NOP79604.1 hypothetical protein [Bacillus paranthracis]